MVGWCRTRQPPALEARPAILDRLKTAAGYSVGLSGLGDRLALEGTRPAFRLCSDLLNR